MAFGLLTTVTAQAERRVALVIGNSQYENVAALRNPSNDADGMALKLESLGFDVTKGVDLNLRDMRNTIHEFVKKLKGADLALFFFAGHGLQVNGQNYLIPTDAMLSSYLDLDFETVPANLILRAMEESAKVNLVFLDACRNNPLAENLARSMGTRSFAVGRGLAKLGSGVGTLISFATQPGNVALDGNGENSPFSSALIRHLGTPGMDITRELVLVRRDVLSATGGQQVPWDNSSLTGDVILKQKATVDPSKPEPDAQVELTFWNSIKDRRSKAYFETYLSQYPDGQFATIARIRIEEIQQDSEAEKNKVIQQNRAEETTYWQSIQHSTQTEMFESYLTRFPEGFYSELARLKIAALDQAEKQATEARRKQSVDPAFPKGDQDTSITKDGPNATAASLEIAGLSVSESDASDEKKTGARHLSENELASAMQSELNRIGCYAGRVDGIWGKRSRDALEQFARLRSYEFASLTPSAEHLELLEEAEERACPIKCRNGQKLTKGRCVAVRKNPAKSNNSQTANTGQDLARERATASGCPTAHSAGTQLFPLYDIGHHYVNGRHPCGRSVSCRRARKGAMWSCNWN